MANVPTRTAPALADLLGRQVQILFDPLPTSFEHVKAGKVRALAIASAMRWETLPDPPTVGEFVPGCEASGWFGVGAAKGTPVEIIATAIKEINAGLADPKINNSKRMDDPLKRITDNSRGTEKLLG